MNNRERMSAVLNFEKPDRIPTFELAGWWEPTYLNWFEQGIDKNKFFANSYEYMSMDDHRSVYIPSANENYNYNDGKGSISSEEEYEPFKKKCLFPMDFVSSNKQYFNALEELHKKGDISIWLNFQGFFWFPRNVFGIERHLYAFYDYPDLMKKMNTEYLDYLLKMLDEYFKITIPEFAIVSEDMSYNNGPMCSKDCFDEFIAPYYLPLIAKIKEKGIKLLIDTDGNPEQLVPWFRELGIDGFSPNERRAGTDIVAIREKDPDIILLGGFDKNIMYQGEEAIRKEFERIYPVMCQGGYIPGCDHQTPPQVTIDDYFIYQKVQREFCLKAAKNYKKIERK